MYTTCECKRRTHIRCVCTRAAPSRCLQSSTGTQWLEHHAFPQASTGGRPTSAPGTQRSSSFTLLHSANRFNHLAYSSQVAPALLSTNLFYLHTPHTPPKTEAGRSGGQESSACLFVGAECHRPSRHRDGPSTTRCPGESA